MPERAVTVSLSATGVPATEAAGVFDEFTAGQRLRRSGAVFGIAILLAATLIPVPIIHLLGIPVVLVAGIITAVRQLTFSGRLHAVQLACPKCGALNRIGGGLGRRTLEPSERQCDNCRRTLTLRIDPATPASVAATAPRAS